MARSLKKGPFVDQKLMLKVEKNNDSGKKTVIKTWSRRSVIIPEFVDHTFAVNNGNKFIPVFVWTPYFAADYCLRMFKSAGKDFCKPSRKIT